jgi:hypothetical protein
MLAVRAGVLTIISSSNGRQRRARRGKIDIEQLVITTIRGSRMR